MPFKAWDGVNVGTDWATDPNGFGGYCTHSSVLFATWHRPYLALFEVRLLSPKSSGGSANSPISNPSMLPSKQLLKSSLLS